MCSEYKDKLTNCVADDGTGNLHLRFELRMAEIKALIEVFSHKKSGANFAPPRPPVASASSPSGPHSATNWGPPRSGGLHRGVWSKHYLPVQWCTA